MDVPPLPERPGTTTRTDISRDSWFADRSVGRVAGWTARRGDSTDPSQTARRNTAGVMNRTARNSAAGAEALDADFS